MDEQTLRRLLEAVQNGQLTVAAAEAQLGNAAPQELPFANLDHGRALRTGVPEVIFCQGKTPDQVVGIAGQIMQHEGRVLGTRASPEVAAAVLAAFPAASYDALARTLTLGHTAHAPHPSQPQVVVATGGTGDLPVAEEAVRTLEFLGQPVTRAYDVGVAGIHRLLGKRALLQQAGVVIAVAGMEGALPGVVAGLVDCPVVAVPTSIGYGASFGGLSALLTMLNSCAPGIAVVNIDNGFGAAVFAHQILRARRGDDADGGNGVV